MSLLFMPAIDWQSIFIPILNIFEIMIRGTIIYLGLFFLLRIFRREAGAIGIADLLLIVIIADAAQNALGSKYESVTEGLVLVGTIVFWNWALDKVAFRFPWLRKLIRPKPVPLVKNGELLRHELEKEMITDDDLMSLLREQGIESPNEVKLAQLEGDGRFSVIRVENNDQKVPPSGSVPGAQS
jgi:uncharacterized membrane protein YcaP (DUF421 family)